MIYRHKISSFAYSVQIILPHLLKKSISLLPWLIRLGTAGITLPLDLSKMVNIILLGETLQTDIKESLLLLPLKKING